jgi:hypothetical protein
MDVRIGRRHVLHGAGAAALGLAGCRTNDPSRGGGGSPSPSAAAVSSPPEARSVVRVVAAAPTVEGAGVRLSRSIGSRGLSIVDPFLLLDDIHSRDPRDYAPGFPRHPHRGFETVTYMIEGVIEHGDSLGNRGALTAGSLQWMTAGRGIVHSEMPKASGGPLWGLSSG